MTESDFANNDFLNNLQDALHNFTLKKFFTDNGEDFVFCTYDNETTHRHIKIYFHKETKEYRVMLSFGLNEFCLTEFFAEDIDTFTGKLKSNLDNLLKSLSEFNGVQNVFIDQKKIPSWKYGLELPSNIEGFELFINPKNILEITNGSFVIINYCDFSINTDLAIIYNIFSDDFGSEARINGAPTVIYDFDSTNIKELEQKIKDNLINQLQNLRKNAEIN